MLNSLNGNGLSNFRSQNPALFLDQKGNPFTDFKTGLPLSGGIQPQPQRTGGAYGELAAPRSDYSGYLSGTDTKPLNGREISDLYGKVADGSLSLAPGQFDRLLQSNSDTKGIDTNEWSHYSPEYQSWAKSNPQAFLSDALAHRNSANNDLGSMGAEGGYANPAGIKPGGDYSNAGYMQIHDGNGLGSLGGLALGIAGNFLMPGLGAALGGGLLGSAGAGAIIGGATSGLTGGNILKGAAMGGLGGGLSNYVGSNFSTNPANGIAGISPSQFATTAGKTGLGLLSGASPKQALTNGVASLAGTSAASNFDSPWAKSMAGSAASTAVKGGDVGQSALYGGLGGLANSAASGMDNPFLSSLVASSPKLLSQYMTSQNRGSPSTPPASAPQQAQMPAEIRQAMVALGKKGYTEEQAKQIVQQHYAQG